MQNKIIIKVKNIILYIYHKFKMFLYTSRLWGTNYHKSIRVYGRVVIKGNRKNIYLAENCSLNEGVILSANEKIILGNNTTLSSYVILHTGFLTVAELPRKHIYKKIIIGNNVWIASGTTISAGVIIGDNVVVGANSFVNSNLESNYFYAGIPAKKIYKINYKAD